MPQELRRTGIRIVNELPWETHCRQAGPSGTETILLVEDDDAVRAFIRLVFAEQGYTVLEARDGNGGLRVAEEHSGTIDLLVTDVVMPGLNGRQLAEQLRFLHPEAKVLYISGYTDDVIVRDGIPQEEVQFLQKPFGPEALTLKIREVLETT